MSRYKCIIFDCDGVLVDSEPLSNQVLVDMANELGADINLDYAYTHFKGNSLKNCMSRIEGIVQKKLPEYFEANFRERSFQKFKTDIKPVEGITHVLKQLRVPFCVASSGPEHKIKLNLELTGLLPYFNDKIFSCYAINKWKPDPAVFLWAAETMGFSPKECLIIEDSPIGVEAGINGGFDVFGFIAHDHKDELRHKATATFLSMHNLLNLIR